MADGGAGSGDVFDVRKVRRFVELMNEHDLAEVDLRQGDQRIRLRRGQEPVVAVSAAPASAPPPVAAPAAVPTATSAADSSAEEDPNATYVTSPMVGTFYVASSPEDARFRERRRPGGPRLDGLHSRSDESVQRNPGRVFGKHRRYAGLERRLSRIRTEAVQGQ